MWWNPCSVFCTAGILSSSKSPLCDDFRASRTNCYCGDWVLHVVLPLTSCDFCSQILSIYEHSIKVFSSIFWLVLLRMRGNLLIYQKCPFLVFFGATDGNFMEKYSVTPSWQRTCLWQMTGVTILSCRSADFNMFQMTYKYISVSSEDFGLLKFPWKKVRHSESGWYADNLIFVHPPECLTACKIWRGLKIFISQDVWFLQGLVLKWKELYKPSTVSRVCIALSQVSQVVTFL